jgi:PAS domain S-box-containing protein
MPTMTDLQHLLIVDDQPFNLTLIKRELEYLGFGYRVTTATNGADALESVAVDPPDVVILDVMMPGMDGFELCHLLKAEPATAEIPVILLTALTDVKSRVRGIEAGADDFISKPFNRHELLARVRSLLRLRRARRQLREERDRLDAILQNTGDAIIVSDADGYPSLLNLAAEKLLGLSAPEAYGHPWMDLVEDEALLSFLESAVRLKEPQLMQVTTDKGCVLHTSVAPMGEMGTVIVLHDITANKELDRVRLEAEQAEKQHLRQTFERYMSPELVEHVLSQEQGLLERRERLNVVVMFADLRGSTRLSSHLPPDTLVNILNAFFTEMTRLVHSTHGTIFDLIGDELMVGYGVPFPQHDAADRALQTAVAMQRLFAGLSERWRQTHGVEVGLGIGLNRGTVVVGNVGSPSHMRYSIVGEAVNVAHRIVELAGSNEIILSQAVLDGLVTPLTMPLERLAPMAIKGKDGQHVFYRIIV